MTLFDLCQAAMDRTFVEVVLYYAPGADHIKPYIHGLGKRQLTRAEWDQFVELVEAWYNSITEEEIAHHNAALEKDPSLRATSPPAPVKVRRKDGYIYVLKGGGYYKIGQSVHVHRRVEQIAPTLPFPAELVCSFWVENMVGAEQHLHEHFADKRAEGEWFTLDDDDIEYIRALAAAEDELR